MNRRSRILRTASSVAVAVAVGAIAYFVWPAQLGGPTSYVVVSGQSMEPTFHHGDLLVTRRRTSYGVGDAIVYRIPDGQPGAGHLVVHRVISIDDVGRMRTLGDNRRTADPWTPVAADVIGESVVAVPGGGRALLLVRSPVSLAVAFGAVVFWLVATGGDDEAPEGNTPDDTESPSDG